MIFQVVIPAVANTTQFSSTKMVLKIEVSSFSSIMGQFIMVQSHLLNFFFVIDKFAEKNPGFLISIFSSLFSFFGGTKKFQFHLFEFSGAKNPMVKRNLIT